MPIHFTKMHGLGNDFVCVGLFDQQVAVNDTPALARRMCDRRTGVGADGLIFLSRPRVEADVQMRMWNADGSRSPNCGNGLRCVAKLAYERGWACTNPMRIQTDAGVLSVRLTIEPPGRVALVRVDMGTPIFEPAKIPVALPGQRILQAPLPLPGQILSMTCVSMGNSHAVIFVDALADVPLHEWGPQIERHPLFPDRVNAHFAVVESRERISMISWERGAGPTQACGTGACAVAVAANLTGQADRAVTVRPPGGELQIEWREDNDHVFMTGPAAEVFAGDWP